MVDPRFQPLLLDLVRETIRRGADSGDRIDPKLHRFPPDLRDARCASFITLSSAVGQDLRGCCGSTVPIAALPLELAENAWQTAFRDPRFPPVRPEELQHLYVEISLLSPLVETPAGSESELIAQLEAHRAGLLIDDGLRRATFLPKVWRVLPDPSDFLTHLKHKAGISRSEWPPGLRAYRYTTEVFGGTLEPAIAELQN